jgi:uncharacterized protein (TIGR03067 family)
MTLGLVAVVLAASLAQGGDAMKDRDKLQGTWVVKSRLAGGKEVPPAAKHDKLTFAGDRWIYTGVPVKEEGTYKLDPTKKPKHIDVFEKGGRVHKGIYALEGDSLKVGMPAKGPGGPRPVSFDDKEADVLTLKREKS